MESRPRDVISVAFSNLVNEETYQYFSFNREYMQKLYDSLFDSFKNGLSYPYEELFQSDLFLKDFKGNYLTLARYLHSLYISDALEDVKKLSTQEYSELKKLIHLLEVKDFFRSHIPDFSLVNSEHANKLANILNSESYSNAHCLEALFYSDFLQKELHGNYDELAKCAGLAFYHGEITREQIATLLEIISLTRESMLKENSIKIKNFIDKDTNKLTEEAEEILKHFSIAFDKNGKDKKNPTNFLDEIQKKPLSEQFFYTFELITNKTNEEIKNILDFADDVQVLKKISHKTLYRHPFLEKNITNRDEDTEKYVYFSVGARDAIIKTRHGEYAKKLYPATGILSPDDINEKIYEGGRYSTVAYPGIKNDTSFHDITAGTFFLALHDELHRKFISTIPNPLYYALLHAVNMVRESTGKKWFKEAWDCIDLDVNTFFRDEYSDLRATYSKNKLDSDNINENINQNFVKLFAAKVGTENRIGGLFSPSAFNDTMWLLLVNVFLYPEKWKKFHVNKNTFVNTPYDPYFSHIQYNFRYSTKELKELSPAQQVACIKSAWFGLKYNTTDQETVFIKKTITGEKNKFYLQVRVGDKPILASKEDFFKFDKLNKMDIQKLSAPENENILKKYLECETLNIQQMLKFHNKFADNYVKTPSPAKALALINYLTSEQCKKMDFLSLIHNPFSLSTLINNLANDVNIRNTTPLSKEAITKLNNHILEKNILFNLVDIKKSKDNLKSLIYFIITLAQESYSKMFAYFVQKVNNKSMLETYLIDDPMLNLPLASNFENIINNFSPPDEETKNNIELIKTIINDNIAPTFRPRFDYSESSEEKESFDETSYFSDPETPTFFASSAKLNKNVPREEIEQLNQFSSQPETQAKNKSSSNDLKDKVESFTKDKNKSPENKTTFKK